MNVPLRTRSVPRHTAGLLVLLAATMLSGLPPVDAEACDLCAIYTGTLMHQDRTGLSLGVGQQFSDFGSIHQDGDREIPNPDNEWVHSSITQILLGYAFTPSVGLQMNMPLISREYRRLEGGVPTRGSEGGLGDISFLARGTPLSRLVGSTLVHVEFLAGIKTPTGNSGRLAEELGANNGGHDDDDDDHDHHGDHGDGHDQHLRRAASGVGAATGSRPRHAGHEHASAVHGHDLTLGSGSVDGLFGMGAMAAWKRLFVSAHLQYAVRGNGDFSYEYANDLHWLLAPGVHVLVDHRYTTALQFVVSGEDKGKDKQQGVTVHDTAITAVYLGPGLTFSWTHRLHADFAVDVPVLQDVSGTQIVPDYRLRGGLVWRF